MKKTSIIMCVAIALTLAQTTNQQKSDDEFDRVWKVFSFSEPLFQEIYSQLGSTIKIGIKGNLVSVYVGCTSRTGIYDLKTRQFSGFNSWIDAGVVPEVDNSTVFDEASRILQANYNFLNSNIAVGQMVSVVNHNDGHMMRLIEIQGKQLENNMDQLDRLQEMVSKISNVPSF